MMEVSGSNNDNDTDDFLFRHIEGASPLRLSTRSVATKPPVLAYTLHYSTVKRSTDFVLHAHDGREMAVLMLVTPEYWKKDEWLFQNHAEQPTQWLVLALKKDAAGRTVVKGTYKAVADERGDVEVAVFVKRDADDWSFEVPATRQVTSKESLRPITQAPSRRATPQRDAGWLTEATSQGWSDDRPLLLSDFSSVK